MALSAGKGGASGLGSTGLNYGVKGETGEAEILKVFKYTGEAKAHGFGAAEDDEEEEEEQPRGRWRR